MGRVSATHTMEEVVTAARAAFAVHRWNRHYRDFVVLLDSHPTVNQGGGLTHGGPGWTVLQYLCLFEMPEVLALLLRVPGLDVNVPGAPDNWTPLRVAIYHNSWDCLCLLLRDERTDMILPQGVGLAEDTPAIVYVLRIRAYLCLRRMIAFRPLEDTWMHEEKLREEIGGHSISGDSKSFDLLIAFFAHPIVVRHRLCVELGVYVALAAEIFALVLLLSDDFLILTSCDAVSAMYGLATPQEGRRFLRLAARLPL